MRLTVMAARVTQEFHIENLGFQGDGVARIGNDEIFVPFALPGEIVMGAVADGRITDAKIVTPVVDRIKPACKHFKKCGGCSMQHASDRFLAKWKLEQVENTLRQQGIKTDFKPIVSSPAFSRRRATFSVKRTKKGAMIGFRARAENTLIDIQECPLVDPQLLSVGAFLTHLARIGGSRKGILRVQVTTSLSGLDVHVLDGKEIDAQARFEIGTLAEVAKIARVGWNDEVIIQREPPHQQFGTAKVVPPLGAFLQATQQGEDALVAAVQSVMGDSKRVVDLFAGCGTFSLPIAQTAEVFALEGDDEMIAALDNGWRHAAGLNQVHSTSRDLFRRPLLPDELKGFDAAVIDPPRAGGQAQTIELAKSSINKIAFVSCNPATFARDAEILLNANFALDWVQVVDQFRWSPHVELVAQFTR